MHLVKYEGEKNDHKGRGRSWVQHKVRRGSGANRKVRGGPMIYAEPKGGKPLTAQMEGVATYPSKQGRVQRKSWEVEWYLWQS